MTIRRSGGACGSCRSPSRYPKLIAIRTSTSSCRPRPTRCCRGPSPDGMTTERGGLAEPQAVLVATGDYQKASDAVARFIAGMRA